MGNSNVEHRTDEHAVRETCVPFAPQQVEHTSNAYLLVI